MIIECFNTKQIIVRTMSLRLQDRHNKCYYIFDHDIRLWQSKQKFHRYVVNPRLIVFEATEGTVIEVKAIPETLDKVIYNNFSESSGNYFRITL